MPNTGTIRPDQQQGFFGNSRNLIQMQPPSYLKLDETSKQLSLDPHNPLFVQNPYEAYAFAHAHARAFFWQEYQMWCFTGFNDVNRLLRDRRLGRERPSYAAGNQSDRSHLAAFDQLEAHSLLELEPPDHTRLRALVNRAFVSRQIERLEPRIERLAHELIDGFQAEGQADLLPAFATPGSDHHHHRNAGAASG